RLHAFGPELLLGQLTETIVADLAHEARRQATAPRPHRGVGGAAAGRQLDLAEDVSAGQQLGVGADEHVPGVVADDGEHGYVRLRHGDEAAGGAPLSPGWEAIASGRRGCLRYRGSSRTCRRPGCRR